MWAFLRRALLVVGAGLLSLTTLADPLLPDATYRPRPTLPLDEAGVEVEAQNYEGVMHEFFGMIAVVSEAKQAVDSPPAI